MNAEQTNDEHSASRFCYATFGDWYNEQVGYGLRGEWLQSDVKELKAAFYAARQKGDQRG